MKRFQKIALLALAAITCLVTVDAKKQISREKLATRITNSEYALEQIMQKAETLIPQAILRDAKGIILTVNYRGGLIIGGQGGLGVLVAKSPVTGEWGVPAFVRAGGANLGLQAGVKEVSNVFVIMDDDIIRRVTRGRFNFNADASAVAGPVGVYTEANASKEYKEAKIYVYSTAKGLFAGVSVKAGWVSPDNKNTKFFYNTDYNMPEVILSDWFELPSEAQSLKARLDLYTKG
ncbi:MAG: lipid-binding SYLF domain-containing protein [Verrucomicrobiota bacterium]